MKPSLDLARRLARTFLLQSAVITLVAVLGVFVTQYVLEHHLMREALRTEAEYFWQRFDADPAAPLPDTRNLSSYLLPPASEGALPAPLRGLEPGYHDLPAAANHAIAHVTSRNGVKLILVFDIEQVEQIALYFGLLPLAGLLALLYLTSWLALRSSQRLVSPITRLTRAVQSLNIEDPDPALFQSLAASESTDHEVSVLANALAAQFKRVEDFIARERQFTRDASHELRTPLAVIKVATQVMLDEPGLEPRQRAELERMQRAALRMEELVETFLVLAREGSAALPCENIEVNRVVDEEIELNGALLAGKAIDVRHTREGLLHVTAPLCVVSVLVGNLLRNAFGYTRAGSVRVHVSKDELIVEDTGPGMTPEQVSKATQLFYRGGAGGVGHGIGLSVVKRLCDRYGWRFAVRSEPGRGTCAVVRFPLAD